MRTTIAGLLLGAMLLPGCATIGNDSDANDSVEVTQDTREIYVSREGLSSQQRFREALNLLEDGQPVAARAELILYLDKNPRSATGADLLQQIDLPSLDYFPEAYREVQLTPNQSLSNLSEQYLGSIYQFYALAKYNGISQPHSLRAGQTIRIPLTEAALAVFAAGDTGEAAAKPAPTLQPQAEHTPTIEETQPEDTPTPEETNLQAEDSPTSEAEKLQAQEKKNSDAAQLHREALNAYRAQDLNRAIELWDQALVIDPDHENASLYRAQAIDLQTKLRKLN